MQVVSAPVTGRESRDGLSPQMAALSAFYAALNGRDMDAMRRNWAQSDDSVMDNPVGGIMRGWDAIESVYAKVFASPHPYRFEFFDYTLHETAELFYVVGQERGEYTADDGVLAMAIRTSRVFRLVDGRWQQVHHHGSIDDADLLVRYQRAVRGKP
jgi:ketosteroid isomerase-like protein